MARKCDICSKGIQTGHRVSHAKNRTKHTFRPNLQTTHIIVDGVKKKIKVCTKCLRQLKKGQLSK